MQDLAGTKLAMEIFDSFKLGYAGGKALAVSAVSRFTGSDIPTDGEVGLTNRRGGHGGGSGGAGNIGQTVKAFIVGIVLYFVAVAIVYTIGTSNIINNATINAQIKNVAYFMSVLGTIIGLIAGTVFVLKLLGGL